ncbi:hypothetical protein ILYODFUR_033257 [Ilyodon furcidens]|uniref:Uncharacterized protein n=1 Tax=Ilyodon furcidens TaxID=33524 RepID=A0ABV0TEJ0_9TELE
MFQSILSVTEGLRRLPQKGILDPTDALIWTQAVCDTLNGKCTDTFAMELYERNHTISEPGAKTKHKQTKMEDFVLEASAVLRTESNNSDTLKKNYFSTV